jgi:hypothetical protein
MPSMPVPDLILLTKCCIHYVRGIHDTLKTEWFVTSELKPQIGTAKMQYSFLFLLVYI